MKHILFVICFLFAYQGLKAQTEIRFSSIDSVFSYAENNSFAIKNGEQQLLLAKWQKKTAQVGIVNFKMQSSFSLINNVTLPVTFLPGEAFGGEPGSFKEVTTGQPYIGNLTIAPQIDLINPASWTKLKSANIGEELALTNKLLAKKMLYESLSATYYNVLSLQEQIVITQQNLSVSDTLYTIINNKFSQGLVRQQDLNDVEINKLALYGKLEQLNILLEQQYLGLKILCDIPENVSIVIEDSLNGNEQYQASLQTSNQLEYQSSFLKFEQLKAELRTNRWSQFPTLSLIGYDAWQQNSSLTFFDKDRSWINSQYVGLKLSVPFPDVNRYMLSKSLTINKDISLLNAEHTKLQNEVTNKLMSLDYQKAFSQLATSKKIYQLKEENYQMALHQFDMEILPSDRLLIAFNDLLVSQLNYSNNLATFEFAKSKININNSIK